MKSNNIFLTRQRRAIWDLQVLIAGKKSPWKCLTDELYIEICNRKWQPTAYFTRNHSIPNLVSFIFHKQLNHSIFFSLLWVYMVLIFLLLSFSLLSMAPKISLPLSQTHTKRQSHLQKLIEKLKTKNKKISHTS